MQILFDTELILRRKMTALERPGGGARFLMEHAATELLDRIATVQRVFPDAVTINCLTADARDALASSGRAENIVRLEPDPAFFGAEDGIISGSDGLPLPPQSIDLAVSMLALQDVNDVPGLLVQIRRALRPDGLFLAAFAGAGTLSELRDSLLAAEIEIYGGAAPRVSPFVDVRDAGALLQRAGFALPVSDIDTVTVRYDTMFDLMRDLRAMGATNALVDRSRRPGTRTLFGRAAQIYAERYADADGRIRATFNFVWLSGWAPHASQQQPLRPGQGQVSLEEILGKK